MQSELAINLARKTPYLLVVACCIAIHGCGGGSSSQSPPPPPPGITSVTVTPVTDLVPTGGSQLFSAQVTGTGAFNPSVNWSVNSVNGGNATVGTIVGGQYTAPAVPPNPSNVTITATSVQDSTKSGSSTATVYAAAVLTSTTPGAASAGEPITVNGQNLSSTTRVVFPGANGTSISLPFQLISSSEITTTVPFGSTTGPLYVNYTPIQGLNETSNSITFTRLPNLRVHGSTKDLSSGETLQLDWRLLGASTPNVVNWTADSGSINAQGIFQAPVVSSESYSRVTGCVQNTTSCDTVLLRVLPFRITPITPVVEIGNTIQLDALQGSSFLSPQWAVLAGGGSVSPGGLFTALMVAAQAGPVPVSATAGSTMEQTSVAVTGAFPGPVNRVYDYADFHNPQPPEASFVKSVAVSGNRAYTLTIGTPFVLTPSYEALEVYDISNPDQPVWIDAGESATNYPGNLFAYGNTLFSIDSNFLVVYTLTTQVPTLTAIVPIAEPWQWTLNNGVLYVIETLPPDGVSPSLPIDFYDMTTGTAVHNHYELPQPQGGAGQLSGISGNGNIVYVSWVVNIDNVDNFYIGTYDVSQSPPALLSTVVTTSGSEYNLQVIGNLLLADSQVYDISNVTPVQMATVATPLAKIWGVHGNDVLATGGLAVSGSSLSYANYATVNISSPSNPVVEANVADLTAWDIFNPRTAIWASNDRFYAADGAGGIGVYNTSANGGPATATTQPIFAYIYDQVLQQQTLYAAALQPSGAGGLACFDVTSGTPSLLGSLLYPNDSSFALQVSGANVFLGLADSLKIVDASNPQAPVEIGSVAVPVNALALAGNNLFAGTGDGRLVVFDVSTPASPKQIASVTMPAPSTVRLSGTLLLVAAGQGGLLIFDVSHPSAPVMLSRFTPSDGSTGSAPVWDVAPLGSAAMLAADAFGVVTIDLSNPSNPKQLYQQQLPYLNAFPAPHTNAGILPAFSLASLNGLTYVGTLNGVMFAFDATVPAVPRLMALNVVGPDDTSIVSVITPGPSNLYLAVQGVTLQLDNTVPQNSIELYYPPAALSNALPITDAVSRDRSTRIPKVGLFSSGVVANGYGPDRFGVMRYGRTVHSGKRDQTLLPKFKPGMR